MDRSRHSSADRRRHHHDDADDGDRHQHSSRRDAAFKHPADHADDRHRQHGRSGSRTDRSAGSAADQRDRHESRHGASGSGSSSSHHRSSHDGGGSSSSSRHHHQQRHQNPFDAPSAAHLVDLAAEPPYAFRDKRNSGRQANGGTRTLDDDYLESRRLEREAIAIAGVDTLWGRSPVRAIVSSDDEATVAKRKAKRKKEKKARKAAKKVKKAKKSKKAKRKNSDDDDDDSGSDSSSDDDDDDSTNDKKSKRSSKKAKQSKSRKAKRRRAASSSEDSTDSSDADETADGDDVWTEKPAARSGKAKRKSASAAAHIDSAQPPAGSDIQIGPAVQKSTAALTYKDFGHALLPGEGAAMAAYIADGKRIPRRGEIGLTADEISTYEDVGYVMSGNRHRRMEAVRIRKENQIYTADEKRALAMFSREERMKRETKILGQFKEMVQAKLGKNE